MPTATCIDLFLAESACVRTRFRNSEPQAELFPMPGDLFLAESSYGSRPFSHLSHSSQHGVEEVLMVAGLFHELVRLSHGRRKGDRRAIDALLGCLLHLRELLHRRLAPRHHDIRQLGEALWEASFEH